MRSIAWVAALTMATGCLASDDDRGLRYAACTTACDCGGWPIAERTRCVEECVVVAERSSPPCLECVAAASCVQFQSGRCEATCDDQLDLSPP